MQELKSCPRCGSDRVEWSWSLGKVLSFEAVCKNCAIRYRQKFIRHSREEAEELFIAGWNNQPMLHALRRHSREEAEELFIAGWNNQPMLHALRAENAALLVLTKIKFPPTVRVILEERGVVRATVRDVVKQEALR